MSRKGPRVQLWSVWQPAWNDVYVSSSTGVVGQEECRSHLAATYRQRLGENAAIAPEGSLYPCRYKLRLHAWVRVGSGLSEESAREMAAGREESEVVPEGLAREQEIMAAHRQAFEKRD